MLLFCAKTIVKESRKFELAREEEEEDKEEEEEEEEEEEDFLYVICLAEDVCLS